MSVACVVVNDCCLSWSRCNAKHTYTVRTQLYCAHLVHSYRTSGVCCLPAFSMLAIDILRIFFVRDVAYSETIMVYMYDKDVGLNDDSPWVRLPVRVRVPNHFLSTYPQSLTSWRE